jgi:pentapeptide repeat protein
MLGIGVIVISFVVAMLGLLHSHAAKPGDLAIWGLTRLGLVLVIVSSIGLIVGVVKEVEAARSGDEAKKWQAQTTMELKQIRAALLGTQARVGDPTVAAELGRLADQLSATASRSRRSDFSMSDFTESNFRHGNFSRASFQGALFREADLRGADMSTAVIDASTKLPSTR